MKKLFISYIFCIIFLDFCFFFMIFDQNHVPFINFAVQGGMLLIAHIGIMGQLYVRLNEQSSQSTEPDKKDEQEKWE